MPRSLPAGTVFDSPLSGKTKIIVVRSGRSMAGKWVAEERNVLADHDLRQSRRYEKQ